MVDEVLAAVWELYSAGSPFVGMSEEEMMRDKVQGSLALALPDCPALYCHLCISCLQPNPALRSVSVYSLFLLHGSVPPSG